MLSSRNGAPADITRWLFDALPHDVLQGAQGEQSTLHPHARQRGDRGLYRSGLSDRGTDQGAARRVSAARGTPAARNGAQVTPREVQADLGEVQSLDRSDPARHPAEQRT